MTMSGRLTSDGVEIVQNGKVIDGYTDDEFLSTGVRSISVMPTDDGVNVMSGGKVIDGRTDD